MSERKSTLVTGLGLGSSILSNLVTEGRAAGLLDEEIHALGEDGNPDIRRIVGILVKEKLALLESKLQSTSLFRKISTIQWYVADVEYDLGLKGISADLEKLPRLTISRNVFPLSAFQSKEKIRRWKRIYVLNFKEALYWENVLNCLRDIGLRLAFAIEIAYLSEQKELREKKIYGHWFYANPFQSPVTLFEDKMVLGTGEDCAVYFAAVDI